MDAIIILAAGLSSRMGLNSQKALLPYKGSPLIVNNCINALRYSNKVIVVTGYEHDKVEKALSDLNVTTIYNENYKKGQFSSLQKALNLVDEEDFFVTTADLINITDKLYSNLSNNLNGYDYVRPTFDNKIGHPVLHKNFLKDVFLTSKLGSAKKTLYSYNGLLLEVNDSACINDADTYNQYLNLCNHSK